MISLTAARFSSVPTFFILSPSSSPFIFVGARRRPSPPMRTVAADARMGGGAKFDGPVPVSGDIEENDVVFEHCVTRTLPPAVTLEEGLRKIKDAVETLKLSPPRSSTGFLRFQVAVPPSPKALNWFCSQPELSGVYPLIYLSKNVDNPTLKSLYVNGSRGLFGIGSAVSFSRSSSGKPSMIKRYISSDSTHIVAYGFVDINFDSDSISMNIEDGSFYFFIPEIELDELECISILTVTLAWNDFSPTFEEALHSLEISLNQITCYTWSGSDTLKLKSVRSGLRKLNLVEDRAIARVYMNTITPGRRESVVDILELKESPSSSQFCVRLSATRAVSNNMLDQSNKLSSSLIECANINAVWASLVVEECSRLGLTYFCVAPGSRSSPLAVAASSHKLITCISCFDERSLAFHAVGYARGSHVPAVVITSSGTAVSNLLPAVVEASQDFVPLLLLTADRPPELLDCGANQAIDQVNHFGVYVRYFFNLPAPTDQVPTNMVLTTLDSAIHRAITSPCGPVHINCPFREPLESSPRKWRLSCLNGLDLWISNAEPFTKYIHMRPSCIDAVGEMMEVIGLMQKGKHGLILFGAIHTEDEMWAALLLAKHLCWPVFADILSGLRLKKILTSFPDIERNFLFIDNLDHALLSDSVKGLLEIDVVIQLGSRITSKRVCQILEERAPFPYIMVDKHPLRHDPSHIVTHRIQTTIVDFVGFLIKAEFPHTERIWSTSLQLLSKMVEWEILFQINAECSLTEPYVAHMMSDALSSESALFLGNSMPIRDVDMYGLGWSTSNPSVASIMLNSDLPVNLMRVAGNRGASGIDGLLSTAIGFAVGSNKRVFCLVGDISLLHDTNSLAILYQRKLRKPMTIFVVNNHGGAIFSLLPLADKVEPSILHQYFYTSHNIFIQGLCMAHGIKHLHVKTKAEFEDALRLAQHEQVDCMVEIDSSIDANANFHSILRKHSLGAVKDAMRYIPNPGAIKDQHYLYKIRTMKCLRYRFALSAPPTSASVGDNHDEFYREGFIISLILEDGSVGFGEVAPIEIHRENLVDAEYQLRFLVHIMQQVNISCFLSLLKGTFSYWIWNELGIVPSSIFPSVRCGLEMAILNAIAAAKGSNLLNLLHPPISEKDECETSSVQVCALLDSNGSPTDVANVAATLVEEGFSAIKLKVARRYNPTQDAMVIKEVRKKVGCQIIIRADANRKWTYEEAMEFSSLVKDCNLQFIEEPVQDEDDIVKFCEESGLPVALDETIDKIQENPLGTLVKFTHPGIVAVVIKPSVVGGFENAALIGRWAHQLGKMAVVSAAFESSLSLSAYAQFSSYLDMLSFDTVNKLHGKKVSSVAHGLGTYRWLKEDATINPVLIGRNPHSGIVEASVPNASRLLHNFQINQNVICDIIDEEQVLKYQLKLELSSLSCSFEVQETGQKTNDNVLVFLHGFLGAGEDWSPIMKSFSGSARCISVDLPGHGKSIIHGVNDACEEPLLSMEIIANIFHQLLHHITPGKVTLVGYSMGARIALYLALRFSSKIKGAVLISGSPGLKDKLSQKIRAAKDDSRASSIISHGLESFLNSWYAADLWKSLRSHPYFTRITANRLQHEDLQSLAKMLSGLSIGRQPSLWKDLPNCRTPLLIIHGEKDAKFKKIAQEIMNTVCSGVGSNQEKVNIDIHEVVEIPNCGHAVHLENPLPVVSALRRFLTTL
ncbi:protein PHYLLO, chloroplastic isoform X1 [Arachis duranensis]|uniref:Protein PHYLLO, chloroplastic isoform X1 n=2 Tax=Arachis duranensis TaxID=130453 RepID=A0A6P4CJH8_ARADU|nr:protein PHYLLO, chloroplastic isoform X1 [Arachis duranensis]XP_052108687.1 protein PHYLLO, chloroplastic isoform X1 [Arachis duranensis]